MEEVNYRDLVPGQIYYIYLKNMEGRDPDEFPPDGPDEFPPDGPGKLDDTVPQLSPDSTCSGKMIGVFDRLYEWMIGDFVHFSPVILVPGARKKSCLAKYEYAVSRNGKIIRGLNLQVNLPSDDVLFPTFYNYSRGRIENQFRDRALKEIIEERTNKVIPVQNYFSKERDSDAPTGGTRRKFRPRKQSRCRRAKTHRRHKGCASRRRRK